MVQQDKEIEALNEEIENERKEHIELEKSEKEEEIRVLQVLIYVGMLNVKIVLNHYQILIGFPLFCCRMNKKGNAIAVYTIPGSSILQVNSKFHFH